MNLSNILEVVLAVKGERQTSSRLYPGFCVYIDGQRYCPLIEGTDEQIWRKRLYSCSFMGAAKTGS